MPRVAQIILTLIVGLALLTWAASGVADTTVREWFERDVSLRAYLVLIGAARLRNQERVAGRLADRTPMSSAA